MAEDRGSFLELAGLRTRSKLGDGDVTFVEGDLTVVLGPAKFSLPVELVATGVAVVAVTGFFGLLLRPTVERREVREGGTTGWEAVDNRLAVELVEFDEVVEGAIEALLAVDGARLVLGRIAAVGLPLTGGLDGCVDGLDEGLAAGLGSSRTSIAEPLLRKMPCFSAHRK
jgi:hypothetical protein